MLEVTDKAKELLAEKGFDSNLGARPLRRVVQRTVLNPLALKIVSGEIGTGGKALIDAEKGEIVIHGVFNVMDVKQKAKLAKSGTKA